MLVHRTIITPSPKWRMRSKLWQLRRRLRIDELGQVDPLSLFGREQCVSRSRTEVLDDDAGLCGVRKCFSVYPGFTHLTKRVRMMTPPNRLKIRKKMAFHCEALSCDCAPFPTMVIEDDMTSIQPSSETISKRMRTDCRNESNAQTPAPSGLGFAHTRGVKKPSESSTGDERYSPMQSPIPELEESLQEYRRPEKILRLRHKSTTDLTSEDSPPDGKRDQVEDHENRCVQNLQSARE